MSVVFLLMAASGIVALFFLFLFIRSVKEGQYDDVWSPSRRMLVDDDGEEACKKEGKKRHDEH